MTAFKNYLVPVDFSRGSEIALKHAVKLAREKRSKLLLVHVLPAMTVYPPEGAFFNYREILQKDAKISLKGLYEGWG